MKRCIPVPVFVLALLIGQLSCYAQAPVPEPNFSAGTQTNDSQNYLPQVPKNYGNPIPPASGSSAPKNYGNPVPQAFGGTVPQQGSNPSLIPSRNSLRRFSPLHTGDAEMPEGSFNGYAQIRSMPDLGAPGSSGNGYHHFSMPFDKYTTWYRPRAATLTKYQRCAPPPFRPRGLANLFARPYDGFRMEYQPYVLGDGPSRYGPSYIARLPDPRCKCCRCQDDCECECE